MAKDATIRLGNEFFVGLRPRLTVCYALQLAYRRALGYTEADDRALADLEDDEVQAPSGEGNPQDLTAVWWATVAAWWQGYPLGLPPFHGPEVKRDVVLYGELAYEAFRPEHREHLADAGKELLTTMLRDLAEEHRAVEEVRGN